MTSCKLYFSAVENSYRKCWIVRKVYFQSDKKATASSQSSLETFPGTAHLVQGYRRKITKGKMTTTMFQIP